MKALTEKLSYANVVATVALVLALAGGTALAATKMLPRGSVGTRQIKNHAVTRAKIKIASLGTVPSAATATHATSADTAGHATSADSAGLAADAESLGGVRAGAYAKGELEAVHVVGAAGQPGFEDGCSAAGDTFGDVGFYRDGFGIVHLVGLATCPTSAATVFTLPPSFRPAVDNLMAVAMGETTSGEVGVLPDGEVKVFGGMTPRLFGVTFREGSS